MLLPAGAAAGPSASLGMTILLQGNSPIAVSQNKSSSGAKLPGTRLMALLDRDPVSIPIPTRTLLDNSALPPA